MSTVTLYDKVLVHLNQFKHIRIEDERYVPPELTQDGVASALNISRPHASQILAEMVSRGELEVLSSYVLGASRPVRRKVYRLSPSGRERYQKVCEELTQMGIDVNRLGLNFNVCSTDEFKKLTSEDRDMFGCLCVLRVTVHRSDITKDLPLAVYDYKGILTLKYDAKSRFLQAGDANDMRKWHSMAADWVLDHGNDVHERLYHLNRAGRDVESLKLIRKARHQLFDRRIAESARIVAEISARNDEPELRRMAALLALESNDTFSAEKIITQVSEDDPKLGGAMMAELYLKTGFPEKALSLAQDCYRGDVDTGMALGKSLLATGKYLEAKDCLMWVKHEMIRKGDLFRMDEVLCCQAENEWNLDCAGEAMRIIVTARSLTANPRILERLDALEKGIDSIHPCSEDGVLLEGINV